MHMISKPLFLTICLLVSAFAGAQELRTVQGKILDSTNNPIAKASVTLYYDTPGDTLRTLTGNTGIFVFSQVKNRPFFIKTTHTGYAIIQKKYTDTANKVDIGSIALLPAFTTCRRL